MGDFVRKFWVEILVLFVGFVCINLIFISEAFRQSTTINPTMAGQLGDFVGGYIGTFFALVSVVLLIGTLRSQIRSNAVLNFEGKYFELLRLHRDNLSEIEVQAVAGRKLFVVLLREYRSIHQIAKYISVKVGADLDQWQLIHISYYCLFYGTGPNSSRMLIKSLECFDSKYVRELICELSDESVKDAVRKDKSLAYKPFEGHQSRLGHYYRHLYQSIKYVDQQKMDIDKNEYTKTIRAQLSNHEQALLLLNSLTPLGASWWRHGYMLRYKLVKNIPEGFFNPQDELDVAGIFPSGYFEWDEE